MAQVRNYKEAGFASLFEELKWRGLISQSTDEQQLAQALDGCLLYTSPSPRD